ncbi:MAG: polysaccharide export protein [Proteobacteria bacterium]|jgi:polysaccharide export outer membrane protein|nr:polysaccharide biosynthesis/export family protein [Alphaproteobacteria bacterium]NCC04204.1 polysaccharide export protein [Pseudomonadota bacterium]
MFKRLISLFVLFVLAITAPSLSTAMPINQTQRTYASQAQSSAQTPQSAMPVQPMILPNGSVQEYILGVGDRIKMTVFGEAELSGEYEVGSTGMVALPLIGDIPAAGQPIRVFEAGVRAKLSQGYLVDPRVSAQVVNYRPFFILGEVSKPGSYPYVNGMTVVNAVALAGGYTYRADKKDIRMKKASEPGKAEVNVKEEEAVMPGDVIRVPERFF